MRLQFSRSLSVRAGHNVR